MLWEWGFVWEILPVLAGVAVITVEVTAIGFLIAAVLGLALALARRSRWRALSLPVAGFVEYVRSTPLLIQVYLMYFGLLPALGLSPSPMFAGIVAIGIHFSTYASEVYRAGLDGVPKGQWEAATALNFSAYRKMRGIILPQAIPPIVPALGNYLIAMFKDTPLLSAIGVLELLLTAKNIGSYTFRYIEPMTLVGVFFLVFSLIAAVGVRWVERKLALTKQ
jgi:polar amino acid transport system permease protein